MEAGADADVVRGELRFDIDGRGSPPLARRRYTGTAAKSETIARHLEVQAGVDVEADVDGFIVARRVEVVDRDEDAGPDAR